MNLYLQMETTNKPELWTNRESERERYSHWHVNTHDESSQQAALKIKTSVKT